MSDIRQSKNYEYEDSHSKISNRSDRQKSKEYEDSYAKTSYRGHFDLLRQNFYRKHRELPKEIEKKADDIMHSLIDESAKSDDPNTGSGSDSEENLHRRKRLKLNQDGDSAEPPGLSNHPQETHYPSAEQYHQWLVDSYKKLKRELPKEIKKKADDINAKELPSAETLAAIDTELYEKLKGVEARREYKRAFDRRMLNPTKKIEFIDDSTHDYARYQEKEGLEDYHKPIPRSEIIKDKGGTNQLYEIIHQSMDIQEEFEMVEVNGDYGLLTKEQQDDFSEKYRQVLESTNKHHHLAMKLYELNHNLEVAKSTQEVLNEVGLELHSAIDHLDVNRKTLKTLKEKMYNTIQEEKNTENDNNPKTSDLNKEAHKSAIWVQQVKYKYRDKINTILKDKSDPATALSLRFAFDQHQATFDSVKTTRTDPRNFASASNKVSHMYQVHEYSILRIIDRSTYERIRLIQNKYPRTTDIYNGLLNRHYENKAKADIIEKIYKKYEDAEKEASRSFSKGLAMLNFKDAAQRFAHDIHRINDWEDVPI